VFGVPVHEFGWHRVLGCQLLDVLAQRGAFSEPFASARQVADELPVSFVFRLGGARFNGE
jgi:hypothetical protein